MTDTSTSSASQMIAIVGGSGAGKGWMARRLCELFGEHACQLSLDDFYRDRSHLPPARRDRLNFDIPRAIDWPRARQALQSCRDGRQAAVPSYDFRTHTRLPFDRCCEPKPLVVAEGLWWLVDAAARRLFALKIFLDCPAPLRLSRRRTRDVGERGRTAESVDRCFSTIAPFHERYVEPQRRLADLVLRQPFDEQDIALLAERLWPVVLRTGRFSEWTPANLRDALLFQLEAQHERIA